MASPRLQTYRRRSFRSRQRAARRRALALAAAVLVGVVVIAGIAWWAIADNDRPRTATASPASSETTAVPTAVATPTPEPDAEPEPSAAPTITIAAVGDMLFDRQVKKLVDSQGGQAPLAKLAARLAAADVAVGNLETTLADSGTRNPVKEPKYAFRGAPQGIAGLKLAGFDAVSLANNHAMDYGWDPMRDTIAALEEAGIGHAGAGADTKAAWTPATIETENGATVAYLAFSHIVPPGYIATEDKPGIASGKMDMSLITDAVREAKKTHDYVIVSFHWGVEYEDHANGDQVKKAHQAIDAGADMVLAHHPHVIQGVEFYNGRLIAYSLGDFVFDHYSRKTGESFILDAQLGPAGVTGATATPVYLDEYGRPEYVEGSAARTILDRLEKISQQHGTTVEIDGPMARLLP